jgi:hypothetical protein
VIALLHIDRFDGGSQWAVILVIAEWLDQAVGGDGAGELDAGGGCRMDWNLVPGHIAGYKENGNQQNSCADPQPQSICLLFCFCHATDFPELKADEMLAA